VIKAMIYATLIVWIYNRYIKPKPKVVRKVRVKRDLLKPKGDLDEYAKKLMAIGLELKELGDVYDILLQDEHTPMDKFEAMLKRLTDVRNDLASNRLIYIQLSTPKQTEAELALLVDQSIRQCDIIRDKIKELLHAHHSTR
jgi:hypothetical protein